MLLQNKIRRSIWRRLARFFCLLVIVSILAIGGLVLWLRESLPQLDGTILVAGPTAPVEIFRDTFGIPHIFAEKPNDAYFGLGYAHAQDRMFQMEKQRRLSQGRLSEVLGSMTLEYDKFLRLLDLHRSAQASVAALNPSARESLNAYAAGVNAYLANHNGPYSPEFAVLLADDPAAWTAADSVAWLKVMALHLSGNWREEALRAAMIQQIGADRTSTFFPPLPDDASVILEEAELQQVSALSGLLQDLLPLPGNGSNNWVVDGRHTTSGHPLLANDPHLGFSIPAIWYLAHLEAPGLSVAGATLPGIPLVIVGTNGRIAWGVTNTGPDTQDLFVERLDPNDPRRYLTPGGSESFAVRPETISVRFGEDEEIPMLETRHGPVLSGLSSRVKGLADDGEVVALSWTMLQDDDRSIEAGLDLHTARDWGQFVASGRTYFGPMQNIVYADHRGNIGLVAPALVPIRKAGEGLVPVAGWDGESDWIGQVPFHDLPSVFNPNSGMIATANEQIVGPEYPYLLGHQWQPGFRGDRIRERLRSTADHDLESFSALQSDTVSLFARDILPFMLKAEPQTDAGRQLQAALSGWDGTMDADIAQPTVFHAWYREFTRSVYQDDLGDLFHDAWWFRPVFTLSLTERDPYGWCHDSVSGEKPTCLDLAGTAFDAAALFLIDRFGNDPTDWAWGDVHALKLRHQLFGLVPLLDTMTGFDAPLGGSRFTIATASYIFNSDDRAFEALHGPVLRAVVDLADPVTGHFVILPGQSGNPFSLYYGNMVDRWLANDPVAIPFGRDQIDAAHQLVLEPVTP